MPYLHPFRILRSARPSVRTGRWLLILLVCVCFIIDGEGWGSVRVAAQAGKVLAWVGEGRTPQDKTNAGEVVYFSADGTREKLLDVPENAEGVFPCGDAATSPDGRYFAFFVNVAQSGRDGGTLYQVAGAGTPEAVGSAHAISCLGSGTFEYSADSGRFAYIDYDELPTNGEFASGTLRIHQADTRTELVSFPNVTGFALGNNDAVFVRYYFNTNSTDSSNDDLGDELAVNVWENNSVTEIATLFAAANCRYSSAQITPLGSKLVIYVGHRCGGRGTEWQLYTVNRDGTELTLALNDALGSPFANNARTNNLIATRSGEHLIFTAPDGVSSNSVSIQRLPLSNLTAGAIETVVGRGAIMPRYTRSFLLPENPTATSRDGRWWAVTVTGGRTPNLTVIDLNTPSVAPLSASVSGNLMALMFQPDGTAIYTVAGRIERTDNTLSRFNLADGQLTEIATGAYGAGVISPDGSTLGLMMWAEGTDSRQSIYQTLALVNASDGSVSSTLFEGITYNESNEIRSRQFAYPLAYRN